MAMFAVKTAPLRLPRARNHSGYTGEGGGGASSCRTLMLQFTSIRVLFGSWHSGFFIGEIVHDDTINDIYSRCRTRYNNQYLLATSYTAEKQHFRPHSCPRPPRNADRESNRR